jgi:NMD protein affecting ribosome stability and mRNA decay
VEVKHPSILQFRGLKEETERQILNFLERRAFEYSVERTRNGLDLYFSDVNEARRLISMLRKQFNVMIKMSTKYAGLRKGRVRVLFVYSIRMDRMDRTEE